MLNKDSLVNVFFRLMRTSAIGILLLVTVSSCQDVPDYKNDVYGNFDALAEIIGNRYCFFQEKGINWNEVASKYRAELKPDMNPVEFFDLCSEMLAELKDGHVNLSSPFSTSYYEAWWSDYPQDFNLRTLRQYYLGFDAYRTSGILYKIIDDNIGYMYYPSFSAEIGNLNLDYVLALLHDSRALVIDIRDNGGGLLTNVGILVSRFIGTETVGGHILHKTGPAPDAFSQPYTFTYSPASEGRVTWPDTKPVYLLTNRSCFSAANDFVAVMKSLPNVTVVGACTGGGGGLPFSSELPNGWAIRFSASPILAPDGSITEFGIEPSDGCEVHCSAEELASGKDAIMDFAIGLARKAQDAP